MAASVVLLLPFTLFPATLGIPRIPVIFQVSYASACPSRAYRSSSKPQPPPPLLLFFVLRFFLLLVLFYVLLSFVFSCCFLFKQIWLGLLCFFLVMYLNLHSFFRSLCSFKFVGVFFTSDGFIHQSVPRLSLAASAGYFLLLGL